MQSQPIFMNRQPYAIVVHALIPISAAVWWHGGYSSAGRAPGCGPGGRGFKPRYSPHTDCRLIIRDLFP